MKQKSKFFILFIITILLIGGCKKTTESDTDWGSADFTSYVAIGNSLTAGVSDGALYEKAQKYSFPNLIAYSANVINDFKQPIMGGNGFSFNENEGRLSIDLFNFTIEFLASGSEDKRGLNRAFNNLGIPLIKANQVYNAKTPADANDNHFFDKILRNSGGTQLQEALSLDPTFITLWIGNNDVLEAASTGLADERYPFTDPGDFEDDMNTIINQLLSNTDAPILIANIFDLTELPYFSSLPSQMNFMETKKYLFGECENGIRELTNDDIILFWAIPEYFSFRDSTQYPNNITENTALNDTLILDATEKNEIINTINAYNNIIQNLVAQYDQLYLIDIYSLYKEIANNGYDIGGLTYTDDFIYIDENGAINANLTNTLFSNDALHPNQFGYLAIANTFIEAINSFFNADLKYLTHDDFRHL